MFKAICYLIIVQFVIIAAPAFGETEDLAELLMNADEEQFTEFFPRGIIFENVVRRVETLVPLFKVELQRKLLPDAKDAEHLRLANRQANAAAVLLRIDKPELGWSLLKQTSDPTARTFLIHRLGPLGIEAKKIIGRLKDEPDITIRRALILSLGSFDEIALSTEERKKFLPELQEIYRITPDAGLHAACEWLLRQWDQEEWLKQVERQSPGEKERGSSEWYINSEGQSMVVITGPVSFSMGSPAKEIHRKPDETQHDERIERTFAICSKEVTVEEFLQFKKYHFYVEHHSRKTTCPVNNVTWYDAVEYCNWLNVQEGIPREEWCYEPNKDGEYKAGMTIVENHLKRTGYRLPTEAEWEYACRAGAETRFSSGESGELLAKVGSIRPQDSIYSNVTYPVGSFKPNDVGLFDMHGNVQEWCQNSYGPYDNDGRNGEIPSFEPRRALRGGSFCDDSWVVRCAIRDHFPPWFRDSRIGFRLARTLLE